MLVNNNVSSYQFNPGTLQPIEKKEAVQDNAAVDKLLESQPSRQNNAMLRKAAEEVATTNKEQEIADSLINAIDDHTIQLEAISNWTDGGINAFKGALEMIAQNMMSNKPSGEYSTYFEDLFQLVMMDVLVNSHEYGLNDSDFLQLLSWSLEYSGTGQHNSWVETLPDPSNIEGAGTPGGSKNNNFVKIVDTVWGRIQKQIEAGKIPNNSLAARVMVFICENGNSKDTHSGSIDKNGITPHLPSGIYNNLYTGKNGNAVSSPEGFYDPNSGGWITTQNNNMSPLMRLTLMSCILKDKSELSTSQVNTIMYGSLNDINNLYMELFNVTNSTTKASEKLPAENVYLYIIRSNEGDTIRPPECTDPNLEHDSNGWQNCAYNNNSANRPQGVSISLDFAGELNFDWLNNLANNYPKRVLGDEDIKEINRLGDSAKMIMQTLKYWFQIMRDERVAIARNI